MLSTILACAALSIPATAQSQSGLRLYDSFDGRIINPSKWIPLQDCVGTVMECVREVKDDHLRLRVRD